MKCPNDACYNSSLDDPQQSLLPCVRMFSALRRNLRNLQPRSTVETREAPHHPIFRFLSMSVGTAESPQGTPDSHTVKPEHHFSAEMNVRVESHLRVLRRPTGPFDPRARGAWHLTAYKDPRSDVQGAHIDGSHRRLRQNCDKKRGSLSNNRRMFGIPYRSIASRSKPKPKANPVYRSGSTPHFRNTSG